MEKKQMVRPDGIELNTALDVLQDWNQVLRAEVGSIDPAFWDHIENSEINADAQASSNRGGLTP